MKAYTEMLDALLTLAVRAGYDNSKTFGVDHAWYNHQANMKEIKGMVKKLEQS